MAEPQLVTGRLLVTLDAGSQNVGRIIQHRCEGESRLMILPAPPVPPGDPIPDIERYDHIVFVREMSGNVTINGVTYRGMSCDAVIAVIPDD